MDAVVPEPQWGFSSIDIEGNKTPLPEEYSDILSSCTRNFDIWANTCYHSMLSVRAMVEWIKGTRLRPYLNALDETDAGKLEK